MNKIEVTRDISVTPNEHGQVFLKPADGISVTLREHPVDRPLPPFGDWRPMTQFWMRRLRDKDVIEAAPPVATGGEAAKDPVADLLAGNVGQVKAGLGELSDDALAKALTAEKAATTPRTAVINAIQGEIDRRSSGK